MIVSKNEIKNNDLKVISYGQKALWFVHKISPGHCAYNISIAWHIKYTLDISFLKKALQALIKKHSSLRTTYIADSEGNLGQKVHQNMHLDFVQTDSSGWSREDLHEVISKETYHPFDLETGPVSRWRLFCNKPTEFVLMFTIHHISTDYSSIIMMMDELSMIFSENIIAEVQDSGTDLTYIDFIQAQNSKLTEARENNLLNYWEKQFKGKLAPLNLPTDYTRPSEVNFRGDQYTFLIPPQLIDKLHFISKKSGITLYNLCISAYALLLHRYSRQENIFISTPVSGRTLKYKSITGYFINPVVIAADFSQDQNSDSLFNKMQKQFYSALLHKDYPFYKIAKTFQTTRDNSMAPVTQAMFNWIDIDSFQRKKKPLLKISNSGTIEWHIGNMTWEQYDLRGQTDDLDLVLEICHSSENNLVHLQYNENIFKKSTIKSMAGHYITLLNSMLTFPDLPVSRLPILTPEEERQILTQWSNTGQQFKENRCIHTWFENQVTIKPEAIALIDGHDEISYFELNCLANKVAHYLANLGVGKEVLVGICMDRSAKTVACLMGILKAGAAYVPLDPQYPLERLDFMVKDAGISVVLTQTKHKNSVSGNVSNVVCVDVQWDEIQKQPAGNPLNDIELNNLAYVIYTSGSSGIPKGVAVEHKGISALINSYSRVYTDVEISGVFGATSLNFDISVMDIFATLGLGGTLILAEHPMALPEIPAKEKVKLIIAAPSTVAGLLAIGAIPRSVITIGLGGDVVKQRLVNDIYALGHVRRVYNMYGPTEESVWATFFLTEPNAGNDPCIGRPLSKTEVFILDKNMNPVPAGVPGELYLGGAGVAREYLNRPLLTKERFVLNPFQKDRSERLYKTGDMARFLHDGNIDFIGRIDAQVKIRGFRIEPGEIESVILKYPMVKEGVVVIAEDQNGEKELHACVSARKKGNLSENNLRLYLREQLPAHMVPTHISILEKLPLNPSGKIDKKALPEPQSNAKIQRTGDMLIDGNRTSKIIARIWEEVLGRPDVGVNDNFFDIGGHSLLMVNVFLRLNDLYNNKLSLIDLYKYPTVCSLADFIDNNSSNNEEKIKSGKAEVTKKRRGYLTESKVAIIGIACRFPGAHTKEEFWENLKNGVESISDFSDQVLKENGIPATLINNKNYIKRSGVIDGVDLFDADFFNITPREAQIIDPQHRLFMECAWEALEDAGIDLDRTEDITGIYAGCGHNAYFTDNLSGDEELRKKIGDFNLMIGNSMDFLSSRIGYKLNLKGPMANVQTACSTSMTSIHMACTGLLHGDCDIAMAGGVSLGSLQKGYLFREGMIMSSNGQCAPFDERASGTVPSQGVGIVVLKRLEDAVANGDRIYSVIIGSAINNDGMGRAGFTAPSIEGQASVVQAAQSQAGIFPESISYIEAHGTGTKVGDPIEIAALSRVFSDVDAKKSCAIGALKANIGHPDVAAGIAGIIKTSLSMMHKIIPPTINFQTPNQNIQFDETPFYINRELQPWTTDKLPRRAGVSSFGLGGCNAHTILEEFAPKTDLVPKDPGWQIFPFSAGTPSALSNMAENLKSHLQNNPHADIQQIAYTLQKGRKRFGFRDFIVADSNQVLIDQLSERATKPIKKSDTQTTKNCLTFMFTGQGSQYTAMGKDLYNLEPVFRKNTDNCLDIIRTVNSQVFDIFDKRSLPWDTDTLNETAITQPALFVFEYSLAKLLMHWGIHPSCMIGHSLGEYVAACLSGVFSLEGALNAVISRSQLMKKLPRGEMMSLGLPEHETLPLLSENLSIAAVNTPFRTVISGPKEEMAALRKRCEEKRVQTVVLKTSHAFHSGMLDPVLMEYKEILNKIDLTPPSIPFISNLTGYWITETQAADPQYWVDQMRGTVKFSNGLKTLFSHNPHMTMVEVGPGRVLASLAKQHPEKRGSHSVISTVKPPKELVNDRAFLLTAVGKLWVQGHDIYWDNIHQQRPGLCSLPTYPFERKRFWIDKKYPDLSSSVQVMAETEKSKEPVISGNNVNMALPGQPGTVKESSSNIIEKNIDAQIPLDEMELTIAGIWEEYLGFTNYHRDDDFFELGGDSLLAVMMLERLRYKFNIELSSNALIGKSTIRLLAAHLKDQIYAQSQSIKSSFKKRSQYIIELKPGTVAPPLFLCHPGAGHLYFYQDLIKNLAIPNAVYGIEAMGLHGKSEPLKTIEKIARYHLDQIVTIQQNGPYWIGGSSFGGMVAYEVAQQLLQKGEKVELLYMVDTPGPGHMIAPIRSNAHILVHLFSDILGDKSLLEKDLLKLEHDSEKQIEFISQRASALGKKHVIPPQFGTHFVGMVRTHVNAMQNYTPKPYPGFLLYFRQGEVMEEYSPHAELAWLPLAEQGANVYTVQGNHITMNMEPNVKLITRQIERFLMDLFK